MTTNIHSRHHSEETKEEYLFNMDGRAVFRLSSRLINGFIERLYQETGLTVKDMNMVIPHQASGTAMKLMRRRLGIAEENFMDILENHGNVIAASFPMALHESIERKRIKRGDKALLLGTSAGLSLGGLIFEY